MAKQSGFIISCCLEFEVDRVFLTVFILLVHTFHNLEEKEFIL